MRWRALTVLATAGLLVLAGTGPAFAKGADQATITGPGLAQAIVLSGEGEPGTSGDSLGQLANGGGLFLAMFGPSEGQQLAPSAPVGALGPKYAVAFRVPGAERVRRAAGEGRGTGAASGGKRVRSSIPRRRVARRRPTGGRTRAELAAGLRGRTRRRRPAGRRRDRRHHRPAPDPGRVLTRRAPDGLLVAADLAVALPRGLASELNRELNAAL